MPRVLRETSKRFEIKGFYSALYFKWDSQYRFNGESHDFWEIVFVSDGKVESTEDEKVYLLEKNNLILHAPMEFHRIGSALGTSPAGFICSFEANGDLPEALKSGIFVLTDAEAKEYTDLCRKIYAFFSGQLDGAYTGQEIENTLSAFLIRLANGERAQHRLANTLGAAEYRKVVSAMTESVCENLTLSELSQRCNISVSYLKLLFRKYAGISPKSYYANLRIQHAIALMKSGISATEISNVMNFSSPNYFSVFFQKQTGETPSAYRKRFL